VEDVDKEKDFYIYHYNQTGYTKDGKAKNIDYTASKKLKQHHYLVVLFPYQRLPLLMVFES
jgi:uncharacterized protein YxeA